jgi:hypothetical protein
MINHRLSINYRSRSKKTQFLASLMTSSVRKTSVTIGLDVCQDTFMSTKLETVSWLTYIWRQDRLSVFFIWKTSWCSQEKYYGQDPWKDQLVLGSSLGNNTVKDTWMRTIVLSIHSSINIPNHLIVPSFHDLKNSSGNSLSREFSKEQYLGSLKNP